MTISDTKLRSLYGKPYSGSSEITDSDLVLYGIKGHNAVSLNSIRVKAGLRLGQWQDG
ncbi:hypothetical protein A6J19_001989 [Salmonella enterica subsp. enterica serovar Florida]|nr:hypothetical protein [Salmonella enterica]EDR3484822.1 hypothetical protein [Salmonella enterica subsp. enterica serovar Midway]EDS7168399.1 hypothetical protein [Salmonella enterica subsp. enterica serovar Florida]EDT6834015.1 hypothetical protein [Salmonella enterica subsp. enterica]EED2672269.1 hypothetical protein [Salmonella enterica subsp. enterica serovar Rough O:d:1,7]